MSPGGSPVKVAVVSDVHANLHALESVLAAIDADPADELWCLGDLVGYGARPNECCELIEARAAVCLGGNHDLAVRGTIDLAEFSGDAAVAAIMLSDFPLTLVGHSHVALQVSLNDRALDGGLAGDGTVLDLGTRKWLLNPGSVGQPRDGDPRAAYLVLDLEAQRAAFHRVDYDIEATQAEIRAAELPEPLAERLATG